MLIDDLTLRVEAGDGGPGMVSFNKNKMMLGPAGGSGGAGGSIYLEGVSDLGALTQLRYTKVLKASSGKAGRGQLNDGTAGEDLIVNIPVGTVIHDLVTGKSQEITKIGERILIAKGGLGGRGNYHFRGPHNTSPTQSQNGLPGDKLRVRLELKLIADVGFVGLPNVGKSSLLNELTAAKSKVANYAFTTLEPNLGVYYDLILADIPGLIEGASDGKGLGIKFLRHVERTNTLFHFVSAESEDVAADYKVIRKELGTYNPALLEKKEYLFLSKVDAADPADVKKKITALKKLNKNVSTLSIHDWESLEAVKKILNKVAEEKHASEEK
jgi:GTP-binding protein